MAYGFQRMKVEIFKDMKIVTWQDAKSTSGYVFSFDNGVFSWNSKKQDVLTQSITKAEYISTKVEYISTWSIAIQKIRLQTLWPKHSLQD